MAILFDCPYCTSTIRVPDDAAGKKGTCPRCKTAILVPVVKPSPRDTSPQGKQGQVEDTAEDIPFAPPTEATPADLQTGGPLQTPVLPVQEPAQPPPSIAIALKRRRKKVSLVAWLVPVCGLLALSAIGGYYLWTQRPALQGELQAVAMKDGFTPPISGIDPEVAAGTSPNAYEAVVQQLEHDPKRFTGTLMVTEFRALRDKVAIHIEAGPQARFFRVNPRSDRDFTRFVDSHVERLQNPWRREYDQAVGQFLSAFRNGTGFDATAYVYPVAVGAMTGGVGYNMAAIVGNKAYRCVYEDAKGRLYFLLPKETRRFELVGRKLEGGRVLIPDCRYEVTVTSGGET